MKSAILERNLNGILKIRKEQILILVKKVEIVMNEINSPLKLEEDLKKS